MTIDEFHAKWPCFRIDHVDHSAFSLSWGLWDSITFRAERDESVDSLYAKADALLSQLQRVIFDSHLGGGI